MRSAEIREKFLRYFRDRGHEQVPSSSLVPADDPTLLFTNAGMVQFKRVFQGLERRGFNRAVTCQKCVRAGGKHNDLEQVGHTARHHTFFEMLGNFSFGDYFKKEAIAYAWEWVTAKDWLGISSDRLYITVHHSDDEARKLWREVAGVPDERIYGLSDKDNFWQMGDTGPAGPCSELLVDLRNVRRPPGLEDFVRLSEEGQFLEIWNLVFMQYDLQADGSRKPLPAPSVDTGAGLERIASVMQGVPSDYDTDAFTPLIEHAAEIVGREYDRGPAGASFRVLADHARAVAFLLADGAYPSNEGRGYVLRRILRRAVRHAWLLGRREPTVAPLATQVTQLMADAYPELLKHRAHIERTTRAEEERFLETIEGGLRRLDELQSEKAISGADAFKLYDTYGFPLDLTQLIAAERGQRVDVEGFEHAMGHQQRRSRAARRAGGAILLSTAPRGEWVHLKPKKKQKWVGYETTAAETEPIAFRQQGDRLELVLEENPFYAESGGQVSDTGVVKGSGWEVTVEDVEKVDGRSAVVGRFGEPFEATPVTAQVNEARRRNVERNHTATHLVHAALRKVLGTHVRQMGSLVAPERLRFDFAHHGPVDDPTLARIEEEVNQHIWANLPIETREMKYQEAIAAGAMAFFQEKYGDVVRVVDVPGVSLELCGGTHVPTTGQIALFRFTHETGAAAGVRRIEAITGPAAYQHLRHVQERLDQAAQILKAQPEHLLRKLEALTEQQRKLEHQVQSLLQQSSQALVPEKPVPLAGGVQLFVSHTALDDRAQIAAALDGFRAKHSSAVSVLFSPSTGSFHVALTDDLVSRGYKAGDFAREIASFGGGRGGGRAHLASGGLADPTKVPSTSAQVPVILGKLIKA